MSKYDEDFKINYDKIINNAFFDALNKTKSVTYDWGWDRLTSDGISIRGQDFIETAQVYALTSADIIFVLLYNDINVTIKIDYASRYATFKNEPEFQNFMKDIREQVRLVKQSN